MFAKLYKERKVPKRYFYIRNQNRFLETKFDRQLWEEIYSKLPLIESNNVWDFYHKIGWIHRKKRYAKENEVVPEIHSRAREGK